MSTRLPLGPPATDAPTVRLAEIGKRGQQHLTSPDVRLVTPNIESDLQGVSTLLREGSEQRLPDMPENVPALLVSYAYLEPFLKNRPRYRMRDWALDSGAFTAHASGKPVVLSEFIDTAARLMAADPLLVEVFALDVIGDPEASIRNAEEMERQGVRVIPTFHFGSPEHYLKEVCRWPKIALGGMVRKDLSRKVRTKFCEQCFARVWPKKVHGFGISGREDLVLGFPWHSVDASSWEVGPCRYGKWKSYGKMSIRGSKQNLRVEIEHYLALEHEARQRWRREMALLDSLGPGEPPVNSGVAKPPAIRLSCSNSPAERNDSLA